MDPTILLLLVPIPVVIAVLLVLRALGRVGQSLGQVAEQAERLRAQTDPKPNGSTPEEPAG